MVQSNFKTKIAAKDQKEKFSSTLQHSNNKEKKIEMDEILQKQKEKQQNEEEKTHTFGEKSIKSKLAK